MPTKYFRYTLKGEHSAEDARRLAGDSAAEAVILRVEHSGGQTQLYVASQNAAPRGRQAATAKKAATAEVKMEEVSEKDVTTIRGK